jgi:6,7-dimethyl-8-ribityllumazine synthase
VATSLFSSSSLPYRFQPNELKIGIVVADWNRHITEVLKKGAVDTLIAAGMDKNQILELTVPGSFELPHGAQILFSRECDAVICIGCVIRGDTPHFDYVCEAATHGILRVGLDASKPCIFGVITTENEQQALDRAGGKLGNKGSEAATAACWMLAAANQH